MKLKLPDGLFKAYLFDCDGTIADSMPLHYVAWNKALAEWGCDFSQDLFDAWGGMSVVEIIGTLNRERGMSMPVADVAQRKEELYFDNLPSLKAIPSVLEHIEESYGRIPLAVVSGSTRESVTASLEALNLLDKFETLVCAGDYEKSKPDPEPFLIAAKRLGRRAGNLPGDLRIRTWAYRRQLRLVWRRGEECPSLGRPRDLRVAENSWLQSQELLTKPGLQSRKCPVFNTPF